MEDNKHLQEKAAKIMRGDDTIAKEIEDKFNEFNNNDESDNEDLDTRFNDLVLQGDVKNK